MLSGTQERFKPLIGTVFEGGPAAAAQLQAGDRVLEVNEDHLERVRDLTESIMTKVASLEVDLKVDIGIGENWEQAH